MPLPASPKVPGDMLADYQSENDLPLKTPPKAETPAAEKQPKRRRRGKAPAEALEMAAPAAAVTEKKPARRKKAAGKAAVRAARKAETAAAPKVQPPITLGTPSETKLPSLRRGRALPDPKMPRMFALDTNVLLHDPTCLFRFEEHDVFIPLTALEELDRHKTGMSDIARNARQVSRTIDQLMEEERFEAVFIGSGAGLPMFMGIPGENANEVFSANEYLTRSNLMKAFRDDYDTPIAAGKKVAVVGGGNVAMDAARTALRLGAEVHVVYRRSEAELPARAEEVHHAKEEGIIFDLLTNPKKINVDENGNITSMTVIKMELGEPDASGRRRPVEIEGSEYDIEVDTVIMSLGTSPNPLISSTTKGLETNRRKCIVAEEENGQTSKEGVFAGGDAVTGAATVILAMGAGKAGAKGIDEYLRNK